MVYTSRRADSTASLLVPKKKMSMVEWSERKMSPKLYHRSMVPVAVCSYFSSSSSISDE